MASYKLISSPAIEPLTLAEAKRHLNIADAETYWDSLIASLIISARQTVENITWRGIITQTWRKYLDHSEVVENIEIGKGPLISINSIAYINSSGATVTLSPSNYTTDLISEPARIQITDLPTTKDTMNACYIDFTIGYDAAIDSSFEPDEVDKVANKFLAPSIELNNGNIIKFISVGDVVGVQINTFYYIINVDREAGTFQIAQTLNGSAIDLTGADEGSKPEIQQVGAVPEQLKSAMKLIIGHLYEHREDVVIGTIVQPLDNNSRYLLEPFCLNWLYPISN